MNQLNILIFLLLGEPSKTISESTAKINASHIVCDYSPLKISKMWKYQLTNRLKNKDIKFNVHLIDAHNIVPVWVTSDKQEFATRIIRPKIKKVLDIYLTSFPALQKQNYNTDYSHVELFQKQLFDGVDWNKAFTIANKQIDIDEVE